MSHFPRTPPAPVTVTVIVCVHNRPEFLRSALLSVLNQNFPGTELLVIDDGSERGTFDGVSDLPLRRVRLPRQRGISRARNVGLALARGEFVTFLDSDDLMAPGALRRRVRWLERHPEEWAVGGRVAGLLDAEGAPLPASPRAPAPRRLSLEWMRAGGRHCLASWLFVFRREVFRHLGGFDPRLLAANDCDFLYRLLARRPVPLIPCDAVWYRRHDRNYSLGAAGGFTPRVLAESWLLNASHGIEARGPLAREGTLPTMRSHDPLP